MICRKPLPFNVRPSSSSGQSVRRPTDGKSSDVRRTESRPTGRRRAKGLPDAFSDGLDRRDRRSGQTDGRKDGMTVGSDGRTKGQNDGQVGRTDERPASDGRGPCFISCLNFQAFATPLSAIRRRSSLNFLLASSSIVQVSLSESLILIARLGSLRAVMASLL
jgi:hypothetical protein